MARLKAELEADPARAERAREAARLRAAKEREARLAKALERLPEIEAIKKRQGKKPEEARASMTDAEATVMKMGDGGFRPAYNPQLALSLIHIYWVLSTRAKVAISERSRHNRVK